LHLAPVARAARDVGDAEVARVDEPDPLPALAVEQGVGADRVRRRGDGGAVPSPRRGVARGGAVGAVDEVAVERCPGNGLLAPGGGVAAVAVAAADLRVALVGVHVGALDPAVAVEASAALL